MALDIIIILIFVLSTIRGKNKGLGDTVIRLLALIISVGLGVTFTESVASVLRLTPLDELLVANLSKAAEADTIDLIKILPGRLGALISALGGSAAIEVTRCADMLLLILSFVLIVVLVWAVASALRRRLKKSRKSGGLVGTVDSTIGLVYGALRGAVLVMLLLAFMLPFAGIFMPDKIPAINENLNNSFIAGPLYDVNPLLMFIRRLPF